MPRKTPTNTEIALFALKTVQRNVRTFRRTRRAMSRLMQEPARMQSTTREPTTVESDESDE